jgi:uncharacterized protein (TIGR00266 family)
MEFKLIDRPDFTAVRAVLQPGESLVTEAGAMLGMSPGLKMETNMRGGLLAAAKRSVLGGESLFLNTYTAQNEAALLDFAPPMPGDIQHRRLQDETLLLQSGAFLAGSAALKLDTQWGGAKGFFGGAGLFLLKVSGTGDLFFSSYGAIRPVDVQGAYVVDTGHIVAFETTLSFSVRTVGGLKSLFLSGEGLVCDFAGNGRLWLQTRAPQALASFLHPFRRVQRQQTSS